MYFLLKTEPSQYSFEQLQREKTTVWDGVTNPVALRNIRTMKPGDHLIIYHTGGERQAVGTASVVSLKAEDPKTTVLTIKAGRALAKKTSLAEMKATASFRDSPLLRQGRLSVVPLTEAQYNFLVG